MRDNNLAQRFLNRTALCRLAGRSHGLFKKIVVDINVRSHSGF
jgi:hypothetical protein